MHRFFMVHSFKKVNRWTVASALLFLAAKVEEQPQKLEHVARVYHAFMNNGADIDPVNDSSAFSKVVDDITHHELLVLQTLGFEMQVEHPHSHVVQCTQLVRASKDLSQTAYIIAHNSLLLTTFCLKYSPKVIACVCLNLACEWKGIEIPPSQHQKKWWEYIETSITENLLKSLTREFLEIYSKCPSNLQRKIGDHIKLTHRSRESNQHLLPKPPHHSGKGSVPSSSSLSSGPAPSTSSHYPRPHHQLRQQQPHSSGNRTFGLTHGQSASSGTKPQQSQTSSKLPPPQVSHHHHHTRLPVHGKNAAVGGYFMLGSKPPKPHHSGGQHEGKPIVVPHRTNPQQSTAHHHVSQQRHNSNHQHEVTQRSELKDRSLKNYYQAPPPGSSSTHHKHPQAHLAGGLATERQNVHRSGTIPTRQQRNTFKRIYSETGGAASGDVASMENIRKKPKMEFSLSMLPSMNRGSSPPPPPPPPQSPPTQPHLVLAGRS